MFSLSLSFETLPLSSLRLAPPSGPVCSALHKSGKHTLTPKYATADDLCSVYICAGMEKVVECFLTTGGSEKSKMESDKSKKVGHFKGGVVCDGVTLYDRAFKLKTIFRLQNKMH